MLIILVWGRQRDYSPQAPQNLATPLHAHKNQTHKTSSLSYDTKKRNEIGLPTLHRLTHRLLNLCVLQHRNTANQQTHDLTLSMEINVNE